MATNKKIIFIILIAIIFFNFYLASNIFATDLKKEVTGKLGTFSEMSGLMKDQKPSYVAAQVVSTLLTYMGVLFIILIIYSGVLTMLAAGNEEKIEKSNKIRRSAVIGLLIVIAAYSITWFVTRMLISSTVASL